VPSTYASALLTGGLTGIDMRQHDWPLGLTSGLMRTGRKAEGRRAVDLRQRVVNRGVNKP